MHRASLAGDILPLADDYLINIERDPQYYNYDIVFRLVRDAIQESRKQLKGFRNRKVGDIKEFVEKNFKDYKLGRILRDEIAPIINSAELGTRLKRRELLRKIQEEEKKVFEDFYEKLGDNSEDE